jgi:DNA transformation protein
MVEANPVREAHYRKPRGNPQIEQPADTTLSAGMFRLRVMKKHNAQIADLPNCGPSSQQMLAQAGIHTIAQLRELGAVRAFEQVKRCGACSSLNLLWALEGALSGRHWQQVARHDRLSLLLQLEDVENEIQGISVTGSASPARST